MYNNVGFSGLGLGARAIKVSQKPNPITAPPETKAIMAAVEIWTRGPNGKWSQRTDAVRLYPYDLFMRYRGEAVQTIQTIRPAALKLWILDPASGRWNIEVHNAP